MIRYIAIGVLALALVGALALGLTGHIPNVTAPTATVTASEVASPAAPTTSNGMVDVTCNGKSYQVVSQANSTVGCGPDGPIYISTVSTVVPPTPVIAAPAAPKTQSSCQPGSTDLSTLQWGPAGIAPQTLQEAMTVLGVSNADSIYLTVLNPCAGDDRVIGWVLGTTASQNAGIRVSASHVPQGTVLDYDPGVTQISGSTANTVVFTPKWSRSDASSTLSVSTLKVTVYWTVRDDSGFTPSSGALIVPNALSVCPVISGIQTNHMSDGGCKLIASTAVTFVVPSGLKVLYDDGHTNGGVWAYQGQTVTTYTASLYPFSQ